MRNVLDNSCIENEHTFCVQYFFFSFENRAIYEVMSKNVMEPEEPQITIQYGTCALHAGQSHALARTHMHAPGHPPARTHLRTHIRTKT